MNKLFALPLIISLSACSTITSGTTQSIMVKTPFAEDASCNLTDSKGGSWYVKNTPSSVTVRKGDGPMSLVCEKPEYNKGTAQYDESLAGATFGNILLGGGIGIFVDAASGAAQKYPDEMVVWMEPKKWKNAETKSEWEAAKREFDLAILKAKEEANTKNNPRTKR